jgi:hypothetical protein
LVASKPDTEYQRREPGIADRRSHRDGEMGGRRLAHQRYGREDHEAGRKHGEGDEPGRARIDRARKRRPTDQPKAVLPRLLAGESLAHGWGDLVTGSATLATLAGLDAARLPLTMLAVALGVGIGYNF